MEKKKKRQVGKTMTKNVWVCGCVVVVVELLNCHFTVNFFALN